jgi:hypothetical protein
MVLLLNLLHLISLPPLCITSSRGNQSNNNQKGKAQKVSPALGARRSCPCRCKHLRWKKGGVSSAREEQTTTRGKTHRALRIYNSESNSIIRNTVDLVKTKEKSRNKPAEELKLIEALEYLLFILCEHHRVFDDRRGERNTT